MGMAVFLQKERIFHVPIKIGAAISGPRIAGKNFYGHEDFSEFRATTGGRVAIRKLA